MAVYGNLKTHRFKNHSKTLPPNSTILNSHYTTLSNSNKQDIVDQTGSADWFLAELDEAPAFGGTEGQIYVIFNPTQNGKAVTSQTLTKAKICYAPIPPFNGGEDVLSLEEYLEFVVELKKFR